MEPIYAPELVAATMLDLAENPKPTVYAGGAGRKMALLHEVLHSVAPLTTERRVANKVDRDPDLATLGMPWTHARALSAMAAASAADPWLTFGARRRRTSGHLSPPPASSPHTCLSRASRPQLNR